MARRCSRAAPRACVGVDANPEAYEHARLRYTRQNLRFERGMVETLGEPARFDAVVFLQTIEHVQTRGGAAHFASCWRPAAPSTSRRRTC